MSTVRGITATNDWLFGRGKNDYKTNRDATAQNIKTRLQSFLGDCFFSLDSGLDWFNLLGAKNIDAITLAVRTTILNTPDVTGLFEVSVVLNRQRSLTVTYRVDTIYGQIINTQEVSNVSPGVDGALLLETGGGLLQENGGNILV